MNPITTVRLQSTSISDQTQVPLTFGQVFVQGHLPIGSGLVGKIAGSPDLPLQVDAKATHPDGSIRHAIISGVLPTLPGGRTISVDLITAKTGTPAPFSIAGLSLPDAKVVIATDTGQYTASLQDANVASFMPWLAGTTVVEGFVNAPLKNDAGEGNQLLQVRFGVRMYLDTKQVRVEFVVENCLAYAPNPQNVAYSVDLYLNGKSVYNHEVFTHFHHARWRKLFWFGPNPSIHVKQDPAYLMATKAVANYEQIDIDEQTISDVMKEWATKNRDLMGSGMTAPEMPMTGGRRDIALLPSWSVQYLLTQDPRLKEVMLDTADLSGCYSAHYRDKEKDRPISLSDYPFLTIDGHEGDTYNPDKKRREAFPWVDDKKGKTPYVFDCSHQPNPSYLPYISTGDYYYLEQMYFWGMWNAFHTNPSYRENKRGLVHPEQLRGQAWALRSISELSYIAPDADPLKKVFTDIVESNLDWFNGTYSPGAKPNRYTNSVWIIANGYAISDNQWGDNTGYKFWQDDFFMSVIQRMVELGFKNAVPLAQWKSNFQVNRLLDDEFCWQDAALYNGRVRDDQNSPIYPTLGTIWRKSVDPKIVALKCNSEEQLAARLGDEGRPVRKNEILGFASGAMGYPSNMQPAVAAAVDCGHPRGKEAWEKFMSRSVKPDYRSSPQFNILPRTVKTENTMPTPAPTPSPTPAPATLPSTVTIGAKPKDDVTGTWSKIGNENETVKVAVGTFLRYGAPGRAYVYGQATATSVALNNATWGDPAVQVVKQGEAFKADPPKAAGKIKTGANKLLAKQKGLQVTVIDPNTLASVKVFDNVNASSTGVLTLSDVSLTVGAVYALRYRDAKGNLLDDKFPIVMATK